MKGAIQIRDFHKILFGGDAGDSKCQHNGGPALPRKISLFGKSVQMAHYGKVADAHHLHSPVYSSRPDIQVGAAPVSSERLH
jgi:hypothetical protein